jgi:hypothetical protein
MGVWESIYTDFPAKRHQSASRSYNSEIPSESFKEAVEYAIALFTLEESAASIDTYRQ